MKKFLLTIKTKKNIKKNLKLIIKTKKMGKIKLVTSLILLEMITQNILHKKDLTKAFKKVSKGENFIKGKYLQKFYLELGYKVSETEITMKLFNINKTYDSLINLEDIINNKNNIGEKLVKSIEREINIINEIQSDEDEDEQEEDEEIDENEIFYNEDEGVFEKIFGFFKGFFYN